MITLIQVSSHAESVTVCEWLAFRFLLIHLRHDLCEPLISNDSVLKPFLISVVRDARYEQWVRARNNFAPRH